MKKAIALLTVVILLWLGYFAWHNNKAVSNISTEVQSQSGIINVVNDSSDFQVDETIDEWSWVWVNIWEKWDETTWNFADKKIFSNKNIWSNLVLPELIEYRDIINYKYFDSYALVYSPIDYKEEYNSRMYFPFKPFMWLYSQFTNSELLEKKINNHNNESLKLEDTMLYSFLDNGQKEIFTNQDIEKKIEIVNWYSVFVEWFNAGSYQCMYFLERLDNNYVLQYAWCWEKDIYNTQNISFLNISDITIPKTVDSKSFNEDQGSYQTINNTLMFVDNNQIRYPVSDVTDIPYSKNTLSCSQMKNYPVLKCEQKYFENYDEFAKLFFMNSKKFVDNSHICFQWYFPDTNNENTVDFHCFIDQHSDVIITYDLNWDVIHKKYPKLVKKYYDYIQSWDLEKAYNLKDTTKSLNDFLDIYWEVDTLKIISIEEVDNWNFQSTIQIDNELYSALINTNNAKIKTLETKKLDTKILKNENIVDKNIDELYPDINYHPYLNKTRKWYFLEQDRYYIIYFPKHRDDLYNKKIDLFWSDKNVIHFSLNITLGEILNGTLSKNVEEKWVVNIKNTWESEKYYDFNIKSESVSVNKQWERKIFIETFNNSDTKYYFAERLDHNQIILYEWKNKNFLSSEKLKEIYSKKEEFRLKNKKNGDCYLHQWNMVCYENWVETVKIEHKLSKNEVCNLLSRTIIWCKNYLSEFKDFYDIYFLESWKVIYYKDLIIWDIQSWEHSFSYKVNWGWIVIDYEKLDENNTVINWKTFEFDINGNLLK